MNELGIKKQYKCKRVKFIEQLVDGGYNSIHDAMTETDTSISTFNKWLKDYEWFYEAVVAHDKKIIVYIQHLLVDKVMSGDMEAIKIYLEHKEILQTKYNLI